jgi:hypothetical protein
VAVVALAGCRVNATVRVAVQPNGSGTVTMTVAFDAGAVTAAGGTVADLSDHMRLADLPAAGWHVTPWTADGRGGATIEISHPFANAAALAPLLASLNGPHGPLRAVTLTRGASFFSTDYRTTATVDLRHPSVGVAADAPLAAALRAAGIGPAAFESALTHSAGDLHLTYAVTLPGGVTKTVDGSPTKAVAFDASSAVSSPRRMIAVAVAIVLVLAAIVLLLIGGARQRARRRRA